MADEKGGSESALGGLVVAFLAGAAVGAAVALLTNPKSSRDIRDRLADLGDRIRQKVSDAISEPEEDDLT